MTSGPLAARPEPVGDEVVRAALGAALRQRAVVGEADPQPEHRRGEREQQPGRADRVRPTGCAVTCPTQRASPGSRSRRSVGAGRSPRRLRRGPATPRKAGSSVTDATTMTRTTSETASPPTVMNGTPATASPRIETTTVPPANTTGRPAVATRRPAASAAQTPGEVLPVPGEHEQARSRCPPRARPCCRATGAKLGMSITLASTCIVLTPTVSPKTAMPIGSAAAMSEPNARKQDRRRDEQADQLAGARPARTKAKNRSPPISMRSGTRRGLVAESLQGRLRSCADSSL